MTGPKIILFTKLKEMIVQLSGIKVLVGGCFDLLHIGHIKFLQEAKKQGDILIVALESDKFIEKRKKRRSFHTQQERAKILAELQCVDRIILLPYFQRDLDYEHLVKIIKPQVVAVSEGDPYRGEKEKQAKAVHGKVVEVIKRLPQKASVNFIQALKNLE